MIHGGITFQKQNSNSSKTQPAMGTGRMKSPAVQPQTSEIDKTVTKATAKPQNLADKLKNDALGSTFGIYGTADAGLSLRQQPSLRDAQIYVPTETLFSLQTPAFAQPEPNSKMKVTSFFFNCDNTKALEESDNSLDTDTTSNRGHKDSSMTIKLA